MAVLGDIEALSPRLWGEAVRQGILQAPHVVWLSDGGRGLWRLFEERFAGHARGILDFYHAAQQLWKGAAAWLDGRTTQARRWFVWARHRLRHGMPEGVLADLAEALDVEGLPATARDTLRTVYAYLRTASQAYRLWPRSSDRPLYAFRGGLSGAGASSTDSKIAANIECGFRPKKRSAAVVPSGRVRKKL